jgi:hypothetical protein
MTTKILFPIEFSQFSEDDKKLVEELMKSILKAEEATKILLDLLSSKELKLEEFRKNYQESFQKESDFEIITPVISPIATMMALDTKPSLTETVKTFVEVLVETADFFKISANKRCDQICENSPNSQECAECTDRRKN